MNYVDVPVDIKQVKTAFIMNFTLRETIFLALGGISGSFFFYKTVDKLGTNIAIYGLFALVSLFSFWGFYKIRGKFLEKYLFYILNFKLSKKIRKGAK